MCQLNIAVILTIAIGSLLALVALEVALTLSTTAFVLPLLSLFSLGSGVDVTVDICHRIRCNFLHQHSTSRPMQFAALTFGAKMANLISCVDILHHGQHILLQCHCHKMSGAVLLCHVALHLHWCHAAVLRWRQRPLQQHVFCYASKK